jgi:hypothetical protein
MTQIECKIYSLLLSMMALSGCKPASSRENETITKCYERITQGNGVTDRLTLEVQFHSDSVSGNLDWLPEEKDSQRGTVSGFLVDDSVCDVRHNYRGEGISNSEKQSIVFQDDKAIIFQKGYSNPIDTLELLTCR